MTDEDTDVEERIDTLEDGLRDARRDHAKALQRISALEEENEELRETVETLRERVVELESQVYPGLEDREYGDLDRDEKVGMVRRHLVQQARAHKRMGQPPVAKVTYRGVRADVFDGHPTAHHCYDLMRLAGNGEGFEFVEPAGSKAKYVKFDLRDVDDPLSFVHGNNAEEGRGAE